MAVDTGMMNTGVNVGVDASAAEAGARQFNNAMQSMSVAAESTVSKVKRTLGDIGSSLTSLKGVLAEVGVAMEFRDLVETNVQFARWQVMLDAVAGSSAKGTAEFDFLNQEVDKLGLRLSIAAEQYIQMTAAAAGTNMQGEETRKVFHALSEELTVMHAGPEQVSRAMMQVREMMSIGNITMQHMKYLATSIPDIFNLAATGLGVSQERLHQMMKEGLSATVFFPAAMKAMDDKYAAGALKAADMTQALMNRVVNSWTRLQQQVNEGGFGKSFDAALRHIIDILSSPEIRAAARALGDELGSAIRLATDAMVFLAAHAAEVVVALKLLIGLKTVAWFGALFRDIGFAVDGFRSLAQAATEAKAAVAGSDAITVASAVNKPRSLGAAAAVAIPEAETAVAAVMTVGQGGSADIEVMRAQKAAIEAKWAAEAAGAATAAEKITDLGNANGKLAYWGKIASDTAKDHTAQLTQQLPLLANLAPSVATNAKQMELFAVEQTVMTRATPTAIQGLKAMVDGAGANIKAWGAMVIAAPVNLFKAMAAGATSLATGLYAAADGMLALMAANPFTTLAVLIVAATVALYEFRDTVINTKTTHAEVRDYIMAVWATIKNTIVGTYKEVEHATKAFGDYVKAAFGTKIESDMKKPFQAFNNWYDNEFLGGMVGRINKFVEGFSDAFDKAADRQRLIREYGVVKDTVPANAFTALPTGNGTSTTLMSGEGMEQFMGKDANTINALMNMPQMTDKGIGKIHVPDDKEAVKDRFADMMRKIQDETAMIDKEDEVYRRYTGTIHNLKLEIDLLTAAHKGLQEYLSLPLKDRTQTVKDPKTGKTTVVDRLPMLVEANQREARAKNEREHDIAIHDEIQSSMEARQQEQLMTQAELEGSHAVMVATERWKEYAYIKKHEITDQYSIAQLRKETDAVIAQKTALETVNYYKSSVEPVLSGHKQEEDEYKQKMQYLMNLRQAAIDGNRDIGISAKELAVLEEQLDEAKLARLNQWRMETKDGLQGLLAAQSEVALQFKDHAKEMHDIYMKNMQSFQTMLDDFITTGKLNWKSFFDGLNKDIVHQITGNLIMKPLNDAMGSLFNQVDNKGEPTTGGGGIGGFFTGIFGKIFGKDNGPWSEKTPLDGVKNTLGFGKQMAVNAQIVNLRAGELQGGEKLGSNLINLLKKPTDEMAKAADENGVVWSDIAKDVGVKFTNAADTFNAVMQNITQGNNAGSGGVLGSVLGLAGSFFGAGESPIKASDTQLGTLPSIGNKIPDLIPEIAAPTGGGSSKVSTIVSEALGDSGIPRLGKRVDIQAGTVNVRSGELQGNKIGGDIIDLFKKPTDELTKGADEDATIWAGVAQDVGVKFTSAADTVSAVLSNVNGGKSGGAGGILGSVLGLAGSFIGAGSSPISAGDTQLGTLPSLGNDIPNLTPDVAPPMMALGGIMTPHGVVNLRHYAGGGIAQAGNPQAAIFGEGDMNEAFVPLPDGRSIPVKMAGAGRGRESHYHMENHFHFPNSTVDSFRKSRDQIAADMALVQQHAMAKIN